MTNDEKREALIAELDDREEAFCRHYIDTWSKKRSAELAGYSMNGAAVRGHEVYKRPRVRAYIDFLKGDIEGTSGVCKLRVVKEWKRFAFMGLDEVDENMSVKDFLAMKSNGLIQVAKLMGYDAPTKSEISTGVNVIFQDVSGQDIEDVEDNDSL